MSARRGTDGRVVLWGALVLALLAGGCGTEPDGEEAEGSQEDAPAAADTAADTLAAAQEDTVPPLGGQCVTCHRSLEESRLVIPARAFVESVHAASGFDCVACHGGDATARREEDAHQGIVSKPSRSRIPELCTRCHANARYMRRFNTDIRVDQLVRYRTSVHGERLFGLGDTRVATCVDCHSAHFIAPADVDRSSVHPRSIPGTCGGCHANESYMASYDIPTDQLADYKASVHWEMVSEQGDLSAPVCNDCHGNHGATPPEVEWIGEVCSQCHNRIADYFEESVHDSVFAFMGEPGCATCHGNHEILPATDEMLELEPPGVCGGSGCHSPSDSGGRLALAMRASFDSLSTALERADSILEVAELAGMPVSQAEFELNNAQTSLLSARAATHSLELDSVRAALGEGRTIAEEGYDAGRHALEELEVRRLGLAVSSVIILLLMGGLIVKIRRLEETT